jgi:hypothetical protein
MMQVAAVSFPDSPCWSKLYAGALFESDRSRLSERIAEAEKAIVARAGELLNTTTDNIEEVQTIEDALYVLRALQTCLGIEAVAA